MEERGRYSYHQYLSLRIFKKWYSHIFSYDLTAFSYDDCLQGLALLGSCVVKICLLRLIRCVIKTALVCSVVDGLMFVSSRVIDVIM